MIIVSSGRTVTGVTTFTCTALCTVAVGTGSIGVTGISWKTLIDVISCCTITLEAVITGAGVWFIIVSASAISVTWVSKTFRIYMRKSKH